VAEHQLTTSPFAVFSLCRTPGQGGEGEAQVFYDINYLCPHWGNYLKIISITPRGPGLPRCKMGNLHRVWQYQAAQRPGFREPDSRMSLPKANDTRMSTDVHQPVDLRKPLAVNHLTSPWKPCP
jgi:hypothetical protein